MIVVVDTNVVLRSPSFSQRRLVCDLEENAYRRTALRCVTSCRVGIRGRSEAPGHLRHALISSSEIDQLLDAICARAVPVSPCFRFRPFLNDPKDDLFVACALAAGARTIVTDDRHFNHPAVHAVGLIGVNAGDFARINFEEDDP